MEETKSDDLKGTSHSGKEEMELVLNVCSFEGIKIRRGGVLKRLSTHLF